MGDHHCLRNILIYALLLFILLLGVGNVLVHLMKPSHDFVDELLIDITKYDFVLVFLILFTSICVMLSYLCKFD